MMSKKWGQFLPSLFIPVINTIENRDGRNRSYLSLAFSVFALLLLAACSPKPESGAVAGAKQPTSSVISSGVQVKSSASSTRSRSSVVASARPSQKQAILENSAVHQSAGHHSTVYDSSLAASSNAAETASFKSVSSSQIVEHSASSLAAAETSAISESPSVDLDSSPIETESSSSALPLAPPSAPANDSPAPPPIAASSAPKALDVIPLTGSMTIDFSSRVAAANNAAEAHDLYTVQLGLADSLTIRGNIQRKPRVLSSILKTEKQPLELVYDLRFGTVDGATPIVAAKWSGGLITDASGLYELHGSKGEALRISAQLSSSIGGEFKGSIHGKNEESESASTWKEYSRWITGKKVTIKAKRTDPLSFKNLVLAAGPFPAYPSVNVKGNLDYDYDTGNWLTNGITMKYMLSGTQYSDIITGSIKWTEDPNRAMNGKGTYEFNLRFNEQAILGTPDEGEFFESLSDEAAFFASNSEVPYLGGSIHYQDSFTGSSDEEEQTVVKSRVTYALKGYGISKTQLLNFLKLWLLITGPVNDE